MRTSTKWGRNLSGSVWNGPTQNPPQLLFPVRLLTLFSVTVLTQTSEHGLCDGLFDEREGRNLLILLAKYLLNYWTDLMKMTESDLIIIIYPDSVRHFGFRSKTDQISVRPIRTVSAGPVCRNLTCRDLKFTAAPEEHEFTVRNQVFFGFMYLSVYKVEPQKSLKSAQINWVWVRVQYRK